jgi:hypothetical protein
LLHFGGDALLVRSEPSKGSHFSLRAPVARASQAAA